MSQQFAKTRYKIPLSEIEDTSEWNTIKKMPPLQLEERTDSRRGRYLFEMLPVIKALTALGNVLPDLPISRSGNAAFPALSLE